MMKNQTRSNQSFLNLTNQNRSFKQMTLHHKTKLNLPRVSDEEHSNQISRNFRPNQPVSKHHVARRSHRHRARRTRCDYAGTRTTFKLAGDPGFRIAQQT